MLSKGIRFTFLAGIVLVLLGLGLHYLLREYNAPEGVEFSVLNLFVATFASLVLTFFTGALLYDYQTEKTKEKNESQLKGLLATELAEIQAFLSVENAVKFRLAGEDATEVVVSYLEPLFIEDAVRSGFFDPEEAAKAIRLSRNMRTYNTLIYHLLHVHLPEGGESPAQPPLPALRRAEEVRHAIIEDSRSLSQRL